MNLDELKRRAAYHAVDHFVTSGMRLGLGHGSTMAHAIRRFQERLERGDIADLLFVPVSEQSAQRAAEAGFRLTTLDDTPQLDLVIDGADEVDPAFDLIKGLGGALLREKIVANAAAEMVVIVSEDKIVDRLGTRAPVPVEVSPFGWRLQADWLRGLGCEPTVRRQADGSLFITDNGNYIYDCRFPDGIADPGALSRSLNNLPGVFENGLFLGYADYVVVATEAEGIEVRQR